MSLDARRAFAAALWDLAPGDAFVLLASTPSAHALVREAPPLEEIPDVVTPWVRTRIWATAHRDAPLAPPLSGVALEAAIADAAAQGRVLLGSPSRAEFLESGALARAFVFAPRGKKAKLRLDRVQNGFVRANGRWLGERGSSLFDAALAALGPSPLAFKEVLRRARESVPVHADDGKKLALALVGAWQSSDVELMLRTP